MTQSSDRHTAIPAIKFSLAENAMDSMGYAVELLAWRDIPDEGSRLKQAILLTAHATELLLKERLRRVHPSLIWEDVDKYPRLNARTVGVDRAIHRLKHIGAISLSEGDILIVQSLRDTRNAIEHFSWETTRAEADRIIAQGLNFALEFAAVHLQLDLAHRFSAKDDDTWTQLFAQHAQFAAEHEARIQRWKVAPPMGLRECSFCRAMARNPATGACSSCGHWEVVNEEAEYMDDDTPF